MVANKNVSDYGNEPWTMVANKNVSDDGNEL